MNLSKLRKWSHKNHFLFLLLLFVLGLFLRTINLDVVPIGVVSDNINFLLNGKAIFYTGHDISGTWTPFQLSPVPYEYPQAELPYLLFAPFNGPLPFSLFNSHIFPAIVSVFLLLVLYKIVNKLIGRNEAVVISLLASINPWLVMFGRTAYEAPLALFLLLVYLYWLLSTQKWLKLASFIPLFLAFYTYSGYKIVIVPFFLITTFLAWYVVDKRKFIKQYSLLLLLFVGFMVIFLSTLNHNSSSKRFTSLSIFTNQTDQVNLERKLAIKTPFTNVFSNKATLSLKDSLERYVSTYSISYLFFHNEATQRFTLWNHGYFYYTDFIFLIIGFGYLFYKKRTLFFYLLFLLALAPLPSFIMGSTSHSQRASLMIIPLIILTGLGIWYCLNISKNKLIRFLIFGMTIGIYSLQLVNFLHIYFYINPIASSEGMEFSHRIAVNYMNIAKKTSNQVFFVASDPKDLYKSFLFYLNRYNKESIADVRKAVLNNIFTIDNVSFVTCEEISTIQPDAVYVYDPGYKCAILDNGQKTLSVSQLSDAGTVYSILQDKVCLPFDLKRYPNSIKLSDFNVEALSEKAFCEAYIIDFTR